MLWKASGMFQALKRMIFLTWKMVNMTQYDYQLAFFFTKMDKLCEEWLLSIKQSISEVQGC